MPAHDLENEYLGRGQRHRGDVERRFASGDGDVLGDGPETGAVVGDRQVVVDGLGNSDAGHGKAHLPAHLRHLVGRVHRVAAAVVEEVADVVGPEDLDQPLVLGLVLLQALELVAGRAEGAAGRGPERSDGCRGLSRGVDHVLVQCTEDSIASGVDLADPGAALSRRLDDAAGGCVDNRRYAARLSVERILLHVILRGSQVRSRARE